MGSKQEIINVLRNYKVHNASLYGIESLGLFGSFARNEQTEKSDVDVFVRLSTPDIFALVHIKDDLEQLLQKTVDVVHLRPRMDKMLFRCIQQDGIYAD